ncbi:monocarboxylate permease Mch4 [Meredithblackwellia eburnea MCA 4105]
MTSSDLATPASESVVPLDQLESRASATPLERTSSIAPLDINDDREPKEAFDSYPDGGGTAWTQVFAVWILFFTSIGALYSWGVFQEALVREGVASSSTLAFIGSAQTVVEAVAAIPASRLVGRFGSRNIALVGTFMCGLGPVIAGSCSHNVPALIISEGLVFGLGQCLIFFSGATLPSSWFLRKRGLATGIVYAGGGFGGAVFSIIASALIQRVGVPWTFRTMGLLFTALNVPAALLLKTRLPRQPLLPGGKIVEWAMFKDARFVLVVLSTALALFPLFCTAYFLPLYATSIGLSPTTGALLLAGFNLSSAVGRVGFGLGADRLFGPVNSLIICLLLISSTTLVIWPLSATIAPLAIYSVVNGISSGGFFSLTTGCVATLFGSKKLPVAFPLIVSFWSPGYFLGAPIAGYILGASGGANAGSRAFLPAMMYSGGLSMTAAVLLIVARWLECKIVWRRV